MRRASLVVDMAAMVDGIDGGSGGVPSPLAGGGKTGGMAAIDDMAQGGMNAQQAMMAAAVAEVDGTPNPLSLSQQLPCQRRLEGMGFAVVRRLPGGRCGRLDRVGHRRRDG